MVFVEPNDTMKSNLKELGFNPDDENSQYFVDGSQVRTRW